MNELLLLEVMLGLLIGQEAKNTESLMHDPFALSLMVVHAAVRRLQTSEPIVCGRSEKGNKEKRNQLIANRKRKLKIAAAMIKRTLIKLESI